MSKTMVIDENNYEVGNKAMASVLLLYYHLINDSGGISCDETIYIDPKDFDGYSFLDVCVASDISDIEETLIRQGAVVYMVCDLNDMIVEYEDNYLECDMVKRFISVFEKGKMSSVSEVAELVRIIRVRESELNIVAYNKCLSRIYRKYVLNRMLELVKQDLS